MYTSDMSDVLIIKHVAHEGPGYLTEFFRNNAVEYRILNVDAGEHLPTSLDGISGLVFMGGPMSVNDKIRWIEPTLDLIRLAFEKDVPMLGHCLGGQLMAKALGASIHTNPVPEYGWLPAHVSNNGTARNWFGSNANKFSSFHWHGESFGIPDGASHVLSSEHCHSQAFVYGNSLAMQCHIEMTADMVRDWVDRADDSTLTTTSSIQSPREIVDNLNHKIISLHKIAETVYQFWLKGIR